MATWSVLCKSLLKNAVEGGKAAAPHIMTFSKMAFPYVKSGVKAIGSATKSGVKFAVEHPKSAAAMTAVALPIVGYKKGLLTFAKEKALGEEGTNKGLVDSASTLLLGSHKDAYGNEKSVSEKTVDTLLGEGAYSSIKAGVGNIGAEGADVYYHLKDTIGNVGTEGANVYNQLKGTLGNVGSEAGNLYYDGKEYVGGMFNGNGMVNHGNGYYDPTTAQYPSMSAVQGVQGQAGMGGGLMNNLNSALSNVTGGNISKMNLASLLLASYMMFGRFGWFSKIAGLALGGMTMKNVNQRSVQVPQQMNLPMQAVVAPQVAATPAQEEDHSMTVHRRR